MAILVADVSRYQQTIDGTLFAKAGVRAAYVQAQQGNDSANPFFAQQVKSLRDAGVVVGAYLFVEPLPVDGIHPDRDPAGQVRLFWEASGGLGNQPGQLPPMLDCEDPETQNFARDGVTGASASAWIDTAAQLVDAQWGRTCGIYCDPDWWAHLGPAGQTDAFPSRPLWAAAYPIGGVQTVAPSSRPPVIAPWSKVTLWQFTDKFAIPGFGTVDASVFLGDEDAWTAFIGD
jgi:GH25 family lysozyme M1 (1,4-beta-N-acetylmuramidase)